MECLRLSYTHRVPLDIPPDQGPTYPKVLHLHPPCIGHIKATAPALLTTCCGVSLALTLPSFLP